MKVVVVSQLPLALSQRGAELQLLQTAEALRTIGVEVEVLDYGRTTFQGDLLHCFTSEYPLAELVIHARGRGIPVVTSAIFAPRRYPALYRAWRFVDPLVPLKTSFGMRKAVLQASSAVIALTAREARDLRTLFGIPSASVYVLGNGTDERYFHAAGDEFVARHGVMETVLCVGSVERSKNQIRLIDAIDGLGLPLVLVGPEHPKELEYGREVRGRIKRAVYTKWIGALAPDSSLLVSAFGAAKVFALPSFVEGQPLSALQAAAAGANLVLSDLPYLRDAFGDYAWYCNPRSVTSIRRAVRDAYRAPRGARYASRPPWLVTWRDVALNLREIYAAVLEKQRSS